MIMTPLLFQGDMVRAMLREQNPKSQTRRPIKPLKDASVGCELAPNELAGAINAGEFGNSPYGKPGDKIWVRETLRAEELPSGQDGYRYLADNAFLPLRDDHISINDWMRAYHYRGERGATVPNIHMPRTACRIYLKITGLRAEKLHDISKADAIAEGLDRIEYKGESWGFDGGNPTGYGSATGAYCALWERINGTGSAETNPWVYVIDFTAEVRT